MNKAIPGVVTWAWKMGKVKGIGFMVREKDKNA
jgi:hypothetical protein